MKFEELARKMRDYETACEHTIAPGIYIIARLDGHCFIPLTREVHRLDIIYDERFRDYMVSTAKYLMSCGFNPLYSYTQSDEISLLFDIEEKAFQRKLQKIVSLLAGEASAKFSLLLGDLGCFDCRISQLPNREEVVNYFCWRYQDAYHMALNSYCRTYLHPERSDAAETNTFLEKLTATEKKELLAQQGINFQELPKWQKTGVGLYWEKQDIPTQRIKDKTQRRIAQTSELPPLEEYQEFLQQVIFPHQQPAVKS